MVCLFQNNLLRKCVPYFLIKTDAVGEMMKPQRLFLMGRLLTWGGLAGMALCAVFVIDIKYQIDEGGDVFTLSRDQALYGLSFFFNLFVGVVGGAVLKIKGRPKPMTS